MEEGHGKSCSDRYERLMKLSSEGIWTIDASGRTDFINKGGAAILGYTPEEMIGHPVSDYIFPEDLEEFESTRRKFGPMEMKHFEVRSRRKDGSAILVSTSISHMISEDGCYEGSLSIFRDITKEKEMEYQLRRSNEELEHFAYIASHDLREPLRMISSYLDLLHERYSGKKLDAQADEYMRYAIQGSERMQRMIDGLLAYSRLESSEKKHQPVDMNEVISEVVQALQVSINESGATIEIGKMPVVWGDHARIAQLMQNIIDNAIKYRGEKSPLIGISAVRRRDQWLFSVRDNGIGLPADAIEKLFQMFHRAFANGQRQGSGMGLAISRKIVEQHGGKIWVESTEGEGSTFFFTLPAVKK